MKTHYAVVLVEVDGDWVEVIRELIGSRTETEFSHIWEGRLDDPQVRDMNKKLGTLEGEE